MSDNDLATHIGVSHAQNIFKQRFENVYKNDVEFLKRQR